MACVSVRAAPVSASTRVTETKRLFTHRVHTPVSLCGGQTANFSYLVKMGDARFLVVDDDVSVTRGLVRFLKPFGTTFAVHTVAAGLEATMHAGVYRAAIIDLALGDGSGFQVLESIRSHDARLPVLILTGTSDTSTINRAFDLGAAYALKPAEPDRMRGFVLRALTNGPDGAMRLASVLDEWCRRYHLTPSERGVLLGSAEGCTSRALAVERGVTAATLRKHSENLRLKTADASLLMAAQRLLREALGLPAHRV
jgi:DNA-binding NarL/FixJ family response regulator